MKSKTMKIVVFLICLTLFTVIFARDKYQKPNNYKPAGFGEVVIDIGRLHNYVANFRVTPIPTQTTFFIGMDDLSEPSMMWLEGGYSENHYLYFGQFIVGYNNSDIKFNEYITFPIFS